MYYNLDYLRIVKIIGFHFEKKNSIKAIQANVYNYLCLIELVLKSCKSFQRQFSSGCFYMRSYLSSFPEKLFSVTFILVYCVKRIIYLCLFKSSFSLFLSRSLSISLSLSLSFDLFICILERAGETSLEQRARVTLFKLSARDFTSE